MPYSCRSCRFALDSWCVPSAHYPLERSAHFRSLSTFSAKPVVGKLHDEVTNQCGDVIIDPFTKYTRFVEVVYTEFSKNNLETHLALPETTIWAANRCHFTTGTSTNRTLIADIGRPHHRRGQKQKGPPRRDWWRYVKNSHILFRFYFGVVPETMKWKSPSFGRFWSGPFLFHFWNFHFKPPN